MPISKEKLDTLYNHFNHRKFVHPDPLEFLYAYPDPAEREVAGLIASSLAYGRVAQILKSVSYILDKMHHSPRSFLLNSSQKDLLACFSGFRHRFTTGDEIGYMLLGAKRVIERYGFLYDCFMSGFNNNDDTIIHALSAFVNELNRSAAERKNSLMPSPAMGSACKRMNLFLRWMVRKDRVDPGGWDKIPRSMLIIPLDTHMHRICTGLDMTCRKNADMPAAVEITKAFRKIAPEDPVRYDFSLTRLGIRKEKYSL
jgi:uncharacterized protein (TIGR02757 family)